MDLQQGKLISNHQNLLENTHNDFTTKNNKTSQPENSEKKPQTKHKQQQQQGVEKKITKQQKKQQKPDGPIDVIKQLAQNQNPLPLLAIMDKVDIYTKTKDGVPLFNLLVNKFLPLQNLLDDGKIKFLPDQDGRTPLHYAVQVDDPKAVFWLLKKGAHNTIDKFGNTPVMDAIRLGHRRSFLLCMHFNLMNQQLPHVAAQYNRVWQLKCLLALGLNLQAKNNQEKTPLQVAVQNYSYQAAQYLASVTQKYQIKNLKRLTDSNGVIKKVQNGKQRRSPIERVFKPLLFKFLPFLIIFIQTHQIPSYSTTLSTTNFSILFLILLYLAMYLLSIFFKQTPKPSQTILSLLQHPEFPNSTDHICPCCMRRTHHDRQDHCDICHTCVRKFHQHNAFCINKIFLYVHAVEFVITSCGQQKKPINKITSLAIILYQFICHCSLLVLQIRFISCIIICYIFIRYNITAVDGMFPTFRYGIPQQNLSTNNKNSELQSFVRSFQEQRKQTQNKINQNFPTIQAAWWIMCWNQKYYRLFLLNCRHRHG